VGDHAAELEHWTKIGECFDSMGDRRGRAVVDVNMGYGWMMVGAYDRAEATLRAVVEQATALHLERAVAAARHNLGLVLAYRGDFEGAIREETAALEAMAAARDERMTAICRIYLATILEMANDLEKAETVARQSLQDVARLPTLRARALAVLARIVLRRGSADEAERLSAEAIDALAATLVEGGEAFTRLVRVETLMATGRVEEAKKSLRAAKHDLDDAVARVRDESLRAGYLAIPEHAQLLALARQHSVD